MQVCVLGPLIVRDATAEVGAGGRRQRRVLARLAMSPGQSVSLDQLEQAAWGDEPPAAARHTLASHVFRLRRLGLAIATQDDRYLLETPTDIAEMERLANAGRAAEAAGQPAEAAAALRMALGLWRGPALSDLDDLPEAVVAAAQLEELLDGLREKLLALDLDSSEPAELVAEARRMASEQPYRERRWELLMLALYRAGRQAEALDVYAECRRRLLDDLGLDPGAGVHRMQQAVLAQDPALDAPPPVSAQGGPDQSSAAADGVALAATVGPARIPGTSTRLIGRVVEQHDLSEVWDRARLATLLGPPGAGKTRLGLELARNAPAPVWYVSLEQLPEAQSVAGAILDVVAPSSRAVDARIGVANALGAGPGLLVLDGCEARLAETVREVGAILAASPQVRVLATSRERLGVLDEAIVPIGPLPPDDAITLLVDRARLVDPRFRLTPDELAGADHLCALVDRLPLGVELVARHLHLLRVDEVIQRVEADLRRWGGGPVGGRAGLWAALDASVDRLGSNEKRALLGLAVMVADADLDLIEAVADLPGVGADSFEIVARLVDASLVQVRSAVGPTRYELLRTLTTYTLETSTAPEIEAARSRYAEAVLQRAARLTEQLVSAGRSDTLRRLDREMPHVRAVLG
ncbi:MAG: AfsR/SARP family transcriptional regulator, partial [Candidatus Limnocylindrales bacterium]